VTLTARGSRAFLSLKVSLSQTATLRASLSRGKKKIHTWGSRLAAGKTTLKLTVARRLLKKSKCRLVLDVVAADGTTARRTLTVRVPAKIKRAKTR
jgi:hypothetical protein